MTPMTYYRPDSAELNKRPVLPRVSHQWLRAVKRPPVPPPAEQMSGFDLVPVDGGDPVHLPPGETVLGRGPLLGVSPPLALVYFSFDYPDANITLTSVNVLNESSPVSRVVPGQTLLLTLHSCCWIETLKNSFNIKERNSLIMIYCSLTALCAMYVLPSTFEARFTEFHPELC